jgi:polyhydroxybutyrate depolymerase
MRDARSSRAWLVWPALLAAACIATPQTTKDIPPSNAAAVVTPAPTASDAVETPSPTRPVATPTPLRAYPGAVGSPGCERQAPAHGDTTISLSIDGVERSSLLHVPQGLAAGTPLPLVVVFHGAFMDGPQMVEVTGFSDRADSDGFLVAYPSAVGERSAWNTPEAAGQADDVAFERALVDEIETSYCVDQHRVYAAGLSMGGAMAQLAACRDKRIVAIALVAAVHGVAGTQCLPRRDVPAVSVHGMLDPLVPWRGGLNPLPEFADHPAYDDVLEWAGTWAARNGCDRRPHELEPVGDWVVPFEWKRCRAQVVVYRVGNGGHNWPGGTGAQVFGTINEFDATGLSVRFLLANALPPDPRIYENDALGYRVAMPIGWPGPWVDRFGYHQELKGAVTFPVGEPLLVDVWGTQLVLSAGTIRTGVPTPGGLLRGRTARAMAEDLAGEVPGYTVSETKLRIDGADVVMLDGGDGRDRLPLAVVFTHGDRAFLLFVYHEVPLSYDDWGPLKAFLAGFELTA